MCNTNIITYLLMLILFFVVVSKAVLLYDYRWDGYGYLGQMNAAV